MPVARHVISSFGQAVKTQMLSSNKNADAQKTRISPFADEKWAGNLARPQGLVSEALHGEVAGVAREAAKDGIEAVREDCCHHALDDIFEVHETGLFYEVISRRKVRCGF